MAKKNFFSDHPIEVGKIILGQKIALIDPYSGTPWNQLVYGQVTSTQSMVRSYLDMILFTDQYLKDIHSHHRFLMRLNNYWNH